MPYLCVYPALESFRGEKCTVPSEWPTDGCLNFRTSLILSKNEAVRSSRSEDLAAVTIVRPSA